MKYPSPTPANLKYGGLDVHAEPLAAVDAAVRVDWNPLRRCDSGRGRAVNAFPATHEVGPAVSNAPLPSIRGLP